MTVIRCPNGDTRQIGERTVVSAQEQVVDLLGGTPLPAATPSNRTIAWPSSAIGRLRFRVGAGVDPGAVLQITVSTTPFGSLPKTVSVPIPAAGDYFWPATRLSLATNMTRVVSAVAPGGTVQVDLLKTSALVAADKATAVLGIVSKTSLTADPGGVLIITAAGPATAACSGGWADSDVLVAGPSGSLRKRGVGEVGVDHVATASSTQLDGDTDCPVTVDLAAL